MSDDEESKKRNRSKFAAERGGEVEIQLGGGKRDTREERPYHTSKRSRKDSRDYIPTSNYNTKQESDDFADLLQSYEKQKNRIQTNNENINNTNTSRNNNQKNNNRKNNNKNKRDASPHNPRITTQEYDRQFGATLSHTSAEALAPLIAAYLQEQNAGLIIATLTHLGTPDTLKFVRQTAEIEEKGGMMTVNHKRPRSPGGCFFFLVKQGVGEEMRKAIFTDPRGKEFRKALRESAKPQKGKNKESTKQEGILDNKEAKPDGNVVLAEKPQDSNKKEEQHKHNKTPQDDKTEDKAMVCDDIPDDQIQRIIAESLQT